jgi:predicted TIM-barrel fold metal-dependent hydrolase
MILDGHIHILAGKKNPRDFEKRLKKAGIHGGIVISLPPRSFSWVAPPCSPRERLDNLFCWCGSNPDLFPFYWIDPMEKEALKQMETAVKRGAAGFKIICNNFFPSHPQALKVMEEIAHREKPILFHSGILWDGKASSAYNRPAEFEILLEIKGLKFALAHIGWPWCDELLAVYGKFQNAHTLRRDSTVEMFIDISPGTPPVYREEALTRLFNIGYDVENNVMFGSDSNVNEYNDAWVRDWVKRDNAIYKKLRISKKVVQKIDSENLKRFLEITQNRTVKKNLKPGK